MRRRAIDPQGSFIVQAPAGSGKTELLIQRVLKLLSLVDEPEEILALTFTRKAAGEMRLRVVEALRRSQDDEPEQAHARLTWRLAKAALARSNARAWNLLTHPARLNIMTIDAFAAGLSRQMPLASGLADAPDMLDDARALYLEAAEQMMHAVRSGRFPEEAGESLDALLLHADHRTGRVLALLADMLACREQWLPLLHRHRDDAGLKDEIDGNLMRLAADRMRHASALFTGELRDRLLPLLRFAAGNLRLENAEHPAAVVESLASWPAANVEALPAWQAIADLLLKADGAFYRQVNKKQGFPAGKQSLAEKEAFTALLEELAGKPGLAEALAELKSLPAGLEVDDESWRFLRGLFLILKLAAAELNALLTMRGQADFTEVALRALHALGAAGGAKDLLLKLDRRIRHVLIDEFQDTSLLQIELMRCLCEGWDSTEGRTLFTVGDPMQSIYRFRKAEVGLFLRAATGQIEGLPAVEALRLTRNFRSSSVIVDWANRVFAGLFPSVSEEDATAGAVAYHAAEAVHDAGGGVTLHWLAGRDDAAEAAAVLGLVEKARAERKRTGILARSRGHLQVIMHALHRAGVAYRAVDILPLAERPEVRDLRALTRALLHPVDRESWAALLRAPFCGLTMADLHTLLAGDERPVRDILADRLRLAELSDDGRSRLAFLQAALQPSLAQAGRVPVRRLVESAWLRLVAPAILDAAQLAAADQFLDVLEAVGMGGRVDFAALDRALAELRAAPDTSRDATNVELLTMHGAKGLEWDVVILPGLGKPPRPDSPSLLVWTDAPLADGEALLLAARPETGGRGPVYDLVREIEKRKNRLEVDRLLYVACTRARQELHLIGHVEARNGKLEPAANTMLQRLWQSEDECHGATLVRLEPLAVECADTVGWQRLKRLIPPDVGGLPGPQRQVGPEFVWAGSEAAAVGNAVHAALQRVAEKGAENWGEEDTARVVVHMRRLLIAEGLSGGLLEDAVKRCKQGLDRALGSERGRWILSGNHEAAHSEWMLSLRDAGQVRQHVIDRSFVDDENCRWIIDYKTASHEGGDIEVFLDREQERHVEQLLRYADVLRRLEGRPIRLGLYFPMLDAWREIA